VLVRGVHLHLAVVAWVLPLRNRARADWKKGLPIAAVPFLRRRFFDSPPTGPVRTRVCAGQARRVVAAGTLPAGEPRPRGESAANDILQSEPRGDRTHDPRLKRPGQLVGRGGKRSQAFANTGQVAADDSTRHQALASFPLWFADRLLTVREVAAFLSVSTRTVYVLCDEGKLAHVRIANAIRIEPGELLAFVRIERK